MMARGAVHYPGIFNYLKESIAKDFNSIRLNTDLITNEDKIINTYEEIKQTNSEIINELSNCVDSTTNKSTYKIDNYTNPDPNNILLNKKTNNNSQILDDSKSNKDTEVIPSQKLSIVMNDKYKNHQIDISKYIKELYKYSVKYNNHFHNTKYNILYILKTHNTKSKLFKELSSCKNYDDMNNIINKQCNLNY